MPSASDKLHTPIFLKTSEDFVWPEDERAFYLLSRDGLFLCRNHSFFRSSVRVDLWPAELAAHKSSLHMNYPKLPRRLIEQVVGFFSIISRRQNSEAAVLTTWNRTAQEIEVVVPEQTGLVSHGWNGNAYPLELRYEIPPLPTHLMLIGDIHSHVDLAAYASAMDKTDEEFRPGLHIVVGRIQYEPPDFHCEITVDGARFQVRDLNAVIAGYKRRRESEVPDEWLEKVAVKTWNPSGGNYAWHQPVVRKPAIQEAVVLGETKSDSTAKSNESADFPPPPDGAVTSNS